MFIIVKESSPLSLLEESVFGLVLLYGFFLNKMEITKIFNFFYIPFLVLYVLFFILYFFSYDEGTRHLANIILIFSWLFMPGYIIVSIVLFFKNRKEFYKAVFLFLSVCWYAIIYFLEIGEEKYNMVFRALDYPALVLVIIQFIYYFFLEFREKKKKPRVPDHK
jgi:peptidoglycan/LPS O-acetylase OafA/YrhL